MAETSSRQAKLAIGQRIRRTFTGDEMIEYHEIRASIDRYYTERAYDAAIEHAEDFHTSGTRASYIDVHALDRRLQELERKCHDALAEEEANTAIPTHAANNLPVTMVAPQTDTQPLTVDNATESQKHDECGMRADMHLETAPVPPSPRNHTLAVLAPAPNYQQVQQTQAEAETRLAPVPIPRWR